MARGHGGPQETVDRVRNILALMDARRRRRLGLPEPKRRTVLGEDNHYLQIGPDQHVNRGSGNSHDLNDAKAAFDAAREATRAAARAPDCRVRRRLPTFTEVDAGPTGGPAAAPPRTAHPPLADHRRHPLYDRRELGGGNGYLRAKGKFAPVEESSPPDPSYVAALSVPWPKKDRGGGAGGPVGVARLRPLERRLPTPELRPAPPQALDHRPVRVALGRPYGRGR